MVHCHADSLGQALGVHSFTCSQVLKLLEETCFLAPDVCFRPNRRLVARAQEGQQLSAPASSSATSTFITPWFTGSDLSPFSETE